MGWLLLWWLMSDDRYDESERPRYFREFPPREETKEEKRARVVFLVVLAAIMLGALIVTQDINYRLLDVLRALP